jgi:hypothetical protein
MEKLHAVVKNPSRSSIIKRELFHHPGQLFFPSILIDQQNNLSRAEAMLNQGKGLVVVINHFSERDSVEILMNFLFKTSVFQDKPIVAPIAYHQYMRAYVRWAATTFDINLCPLVTEDTIKREEYKNLEINKGMPEYIDAGLSVLKKGGILLVAPQGGRRPRLIPVQSDSAIPIEPNPPTIGTFMANAARNEFDNYGFLFVGLGINETFDYSSPDAGGLNIGKEYVLRVGDVISAQELLLRADGKRKQIDPIVYQELAKLVPPEYV